MNNLCKSVAIALGISLRVTAQPAPLPQIQSDAITEASGLAVSPKDDHLLWILNDSGGTTDLHLIDLQGADRGRVKVNGVVNRDWEDLSSFTLDGVSYLLIADTGDNASKRETCTLLLVREPTLPEAGKPISGTLDVERTIEFRYEGGPADCESVAVDAKAGKILLVTKRTKPPHVHELPLKPATSEVQIARRTGTTNVDSPAGTRIPFCNQPTGLCVSNDGSSAAVVTYYGVFLFPRTKDESWVDAFARKPISLGPHALPQAESIAFSQDGKKLYVVSEGPHSLIRSFAVKADNGR